MNETLTLSQIIRALENANDSEKELTVCFDFGSAIPTNVDSSRGDYSHLALGYELTGYDAGERHMAKMMLPDLITLLTAAKSQSFTGWKGGDYAAGKDTPVWVDNPGNWSNTAITGVKNYGYYVVIETKHVER